MRGAGPSSAARSARRGSFEKTSMIGSRIPSRRCSFSTSSSWSQSTNVTTMPSLPARAVRPGTVHVRLVLLGRVVVHDHVDVVDVDAASGDVGRDEHAVLVLLEVASAPSRAPTGAGRRGSRPRARLRA